VIFYVDNDRVSFDFSSVVSGFSDFVDCTVSYLAVFSVYIAVVVFCVVDRVGIIGNS